MRAPILVAWLALWLAAPAMAQTEIAVPANAGWQHAQTGAIFRSKLAGIPRSQIQDNSKNELDIAVKYGDADVTLSFFLFRPALMSVPLWFDRSETQIGLAEMFAGVTPAGATRSFATPGTTITGAMRRSYVPGKADIKATALAILPLGDWLLKVRMTSSTLDPAALDAKLDAVLQGIGWPEGVAEPTVAVPVPACAEALAYARKAKLKKPSMADALIGSVLLGVVADKEAKGEKGTPVDWCREGDARKDFGVYRDKASRDAYTLALGDAGRTLSISPGVPLGGGGDGFMLTLGLLDRTLVYPSFDRLPTPEAAFEAVNKSAPVSSTARGGKDITISAPPK